MSGCVDQVVAPAIREAAIRLLTRHGIEVVLAEGEACCGSLSHHLGREHEALAFVKNNIDAWTREIEAGLDAILITASGCGTTIKDYGFMLRSDPAYAAKAARRLRARARTSPNISRRSSLPSPDARAGWRRLSLGLFHAARPEDHARAEGAAAPRPASR